MTLRTRCSLRSVWIGVSISCMALCGLPAAAEEGAHENASSTDLTEISLENLMNIEVTSVSKRKETRREAAAAIFVLTQEDIRRSGATTVAEALRLVPGLDVARISAAYWAVTSRGFNDLYANKLLVLMDGRSVYTPLFAGVYWDTLDTLLEDIDRIEVIRGPGGALWGANAVNGVINIITKNARDTQGGLVTGGAGTEEEGFGGFRYGGKLSERAYYRVYGKYSDRDASRLASGGDADDAWRLGVGGFRVDSAWDEDELTVLGGACDGASSNMSTVYSLWPPYMRNVTEHDDLPAAHVLGRWTRHVSDDSELALQVYYDWEHRLGDATYGNETQTFDVDFQHRVRLAEQHELVWGGGYRSFRDASGPFFSNYYEPETRRDDLFSAFIQDEISLRDDRLRLTLGTKIEHNDYTGIEIQPTARVAWVPNERHAFWAAVSRSVRTPSRAESDIRIALLALPGVLVQAVGNPDMKSEDLLAYEAGYRVRCSKSVTMDLAAFYNLYDDLRTIEFRRPFFALSPSLPHLVIPFPGKNNMEAETAGAELSAEWQAASWWRVRATYSYLHMDVNIHPKTFDLLSQSTEGASPQQQVSLFSSMDLGKHVELDALFRYVDALPSLAVDSYTTLDLRLGWRPTEDFEVAVVGQNLLNAHHQEFSQSLLGSAPAEIQRGVYAKATWRF